MQKGFGIMELFDLTNLRDDHLSSRGGRTTYNLISSGSYAVDINYLKAGYKSRLHLHELKFNRLFVISGLIEVTIFTGENDRIVKTLGIHEDSRKVDITPNSPHQIVALENSVIVEVDFTRCMTKDMHVLNNLEEIF